MRLAIQWHSMLQYNWSHCTGEVYVDVEYSSVSSTELSVLTGFAISGPSSDHHSIELGVEQVAEFSFQSGIFPEHYVHKFRLTRLCCKPCKGYICQFFTSVPSPFGPGPRIMTNLDLLLLKLFWTDSGVSRNDNPPSHQGMGWWWPGEDTVTQGTAGAGHRYWKYQLWAPGSMYSNLMPYRWMCSSISFPWIKDNIFTS